MGCSFEIECLHTNLLLFSGWWFNKYIKLNLKISLANILNGLLV